VVDGNIFYPLPFIEESQKDLSINTRMSSYEVPILIGHCYAAMQDKFFALFYAINFCRNKFYFGKGDKRRIIFVPQCANCRLHFLLKRIEIVNVEQKSRLSKNGILDGPEVIVVSSFAVGIQ